MIPFVIFHVDFPTEKVLLFHLIIFLNAPRMHVRMKKYFVNGEMQISNTFE